MNAEPARQELLAATEAAQGRASSPEASAWVSANAGAGKTHVLKLRVLRLMLAGTPPERILCLTYTKAAAAEMAQRVFDELSEWATLDDEKLGKVISDLLQRQPLPEDLLAARMLFARAIETPGGLKVQTIHAFCERLLQRFPLEAAVPPGFSILDDETASTLRNESIDRVLTLANADPDGVLGQALQLCVAKAAEERFDLLLAMALGERSWLRAASQWEDHSPSDHIGPVEGYYRQLFSLPVGQTQDGLLQEMSNVLTDATLTRASEVLLTGGKLDQRLADQLAVAQRAVDSPTKVRELGEALLTKTGTPRSDRQFVSKGIRETEPGLADALCDARDTFHKLKQQQLALDLVLATTALVSLADQVMQFYFEAKSRRAALDFEDLIDRTSALLGEANAAEWVLYKLDGGLDHILVDEAQDTSPAQWRVIQSLAEEFFAGEGASETPRSVFAVGDEKQSIYSFQGAAPRMFAQAGEAFQQAAKYAKQEWHRVPLTLSFRTVEPLLQAVDAILSDEGRVPGLTSGSSEIRHVALRTGEAGLFEIWPTIKPEDVEPSAAFDPLGEQTARSPVKRLADKIADRIQRFLDDKEILVSQGRPIRPQDIIILVRKRQPFAPEMVRALKSRGIPVAGADRLVLTEQIVIQDLLALGEFLVLPEDDLSLAAILKSPLFGLDDDDLLSFAPERKGALWSALMAASRDNERLKEASETLKRWRALSDFLPPYEFFATLLDRDGCRQKFLNRLGIDAADPLDEFINLAMSYDDQEPASLQGFITWMRDGERTIKRDMEQGRDEVRVMTVHGAKGLEAPIVFLPDTCSAPGASPATPLVDLAVEDTLGGGAPVHAWSTKGAGQLAPIAAGRAAKTKRETEENNRLLYVALTRARDRIYVTGFEGKRPPQAGCWYDIIWQGVEELVSENTDSDGNPLWILQSEQVLAVESKQVAVGKRNSEVPLPDWAMRRVTSEPQLVIPLAPSKLAPLEIDPEGEAQGIEDVREQRQDFSEPPAASASHMASENRFLRGLLTHGLLEHLPSYPAEQWDMLAKRFIELRGSALRERVRHEIVSESLAIMRTADFAALFGSDSWAEVSLAAEVPRESGDGPPLRVTGQIDRLVQTDHEVLIVDYKTNRPPPRKADAIPEAYILQMAAYQLAIKEIYPGKSIRSAILWTDGPELMEIPQAMIAEHQQRLWTLRTTDLDAL